MDKERMCPRKLAATVAALAAALSLGALAPGASADPSPPVLNAFHAFVGDPLFGLDTPQGTLLGIKPDEKTAMASTTKIWTLDFLAHALAQGKVHLDDLVTITPYEASFDPKWNSLMTDVNGKSLQAGEVVKLRDLARGMMYHSGNDAAFAIGHYLAQAYFGPQADEYAFVTLMNDHAAALGQASTHFANPNGWDNPAHFTTARELAEEMQHALADPYFRTVVGFNGTYKATTQGPNGPKMYSFNWSAGYPGWEGEKGGNTPNCDGPNKGYCDVVAATRIGRRVVAAGMQENGADNQAMLDWGFASIFHPDLRGTSAAAGGVSREALDCFASNRAITATLPPTGPVDLALWNANVDGSTLTKLTEATLPGSGNKTKVAGDVAVSRLSSDEIILATRQGTTISLSRWSYTRAGTLQLVNSGIVAGAGIAMGIQPLGGDTFLTTIVDPKGDLVLKTWRLPGFGPGIVNLDTHIEDRPQPFNDVELSGPLTADFLTGHRAMTAAQQQDGHVILETWSIDQATGTIARITGTYVGSDAASSLSLTPFYVQPLFDGEFPPPHYAVAWRNTNGELEIHVVNVQGIGIVPLPFGEVTLPGAQIELAPLGTGGLTSMVTDASGNAQLTSWDAFRDAGGLITLSQVSEHDAPATDSFNLCRLPSAPHAEGDYVAATRDTDGQLRLRTYRSGDRPY